MEFSILPNGSLKYRRSVEIRARTELCATFHWGRHKQCRRSLFDADKL